MWVLWLNCGCAIFFGDSEFGTRTILVITVCTD